MPHDAFEGVCLCGLAFFKQLLDNPLCHGEVRLALCQASFRFVGLTVVHMVHMRAANKSSMAASLFVASMGHLMSHRCWTPWVPFQNHGSGAAGTMPNCNRTSTVWVMGEDVWPHGSVPAARAALILLHLLCQPFACSANVRAGSFACLIHARMEAMGLDTSG